MKTIQNSNTKEIKRVSDKDANKITENIFWNYIPKNVWKTATRVAKVEKPETLEKEKKKKA